MEEVMLESRFVSLWNRLGAHGPVGPVYEMLSQKYSEPHRKHHNMDHIAHCLSEFDKVREIVGRPNALEFSIWFHDVDYDPTSKTNEITSAELGVVTTNNALLGSGFSDSVRGYILATRHYGARSDNMDTNIMTDIDMVILGEGPELFDKYEQGIRQEYSMFSDNEYVDGRVNFLRGLLQRPRIYFTGSFHYRYEDKARENIKRTITKLSRSRPKLVRQR